MAKYRYIGKNTTYFPDLGIVVDTGDVVELDYVPVSVWLEPVDNTKSTKQPTDKPSISEGA